MDMKKQQEQQKKNKQKNTQIPWGIYVPHLIII